MTRAAQPGHADDDSDGRFQRHILQRPRHRHVLEAQRLLTCCAAIADSGLFPGSSTDERRFRHISPVQAPDERFLGHSVAGVARQHIVETTYCVTYFPVPRHRGGTERVSVWKSGPGWREECQGHDGPEGTGVCPDGRHLNVWHSSRISGHFIVLREDQGGSRSS